MSDQESTLDEFVDEHTTDEKQEVSDLRLPEIDSIPDDWELVTVEGISTDILGGGTPSKSNDNYWNGNIPWASVKDLNGIELSDTEDHITETAIENSTTKLIPANSIIISTRMTVGEPFLNQVDMAINQDMKALIPDSKRANSLFLVYSLRDKDPYLKSLGRGTTVDGITTRDLSLTHLGLPSIEEQRKIATILYSVDQAIEKTDEIVEQLGRVQKAATQSLLRGGNSDLTQKTARVGPKEVLIPEHWNIKTISELSNIKNGDRIVKGHDYSDTPTEYPFIRIVDMESGSISTTDIKYLKKETAKEMNRGIIYSDEVYITVTGRVGDAGTIPEELDGARFTDNAAKLYDLDEITPEYLSLYLRSKYGQDEVHRFTVGSTQPKLSMYRVEKMEVIVPPIEEQKKIVNKINKIQQSKEMNKDVLRSLATLKRGLMQDLLSGKVRTTDTNIQVPHNVAQHG